MTHGKARLENGILTITTQPKGKKKPLVRVYKVEDVRPDPRVAYPAYSLTKGRMEAVPAEDGGYEFVPDGEVWHVSVDKYGPMCDCPHRTYEKTHRCKHISACVAVGLLPKE